MGDIGPIGLDLFDAGDKLICCTRAVYDMAATDERFRKFVQAAIFKFSNSDWGDVDESDWEMNDADPDYALGSYGRGGERIWIKSDGDCLTVMFPKEW